jgi:hypothetical protein
MNGEGFWYSLGRFFYRTFHWLENLGLAGFNPNKVFIVIAFIAFFAWLRMQAKYTKDAKQNNKLV